MGNDVVITFLLFLSFNIVIYVALLRWASQINDIVKNLENINAKLDMLIVVNLKPKGQEAGIDIDDNPNDEALH
jgi:hypothetical protein